MSNEKLADIMNMKAIISDRKRGINMEEIKKGILYPKPLKEGNQICLIRQMHTQRKPSKRSAVIGKGEVFK